MELRVIPGGAYTPKGGVPSETFSFIYPHTGCSLDVGPHQVENILRKGGYGPGMGAPVKIIANLSLTPSLPPFPPYQVSTYKDLPNPQFLPPGTT